MDRRDDSQLPPNTASSIASARFRPAHREHGSLSISAPIEASARPPQSEFAASHLFPRTETPYAIYSEAGDIPSRISEGSSPRAVTPDGGNEGSPRSLGSPLLFPPSSAATLSRKTGATAIAPFRRGLVEDEMKHEELSKGLGITGTEEENGNGTEVKNIELATGLEAPKPSPNLEEEPNLILPILSDALTFAAGPFSATNLSPIVVQQKGRSNSFSQPALDEFRAQIFSHPADGSGFTLFDVPHHSTAGPDPRDLHRILAASGPYQEFTSDVDLSFATTQHIKKMLKQSLEREGVTSARVWESQLYNLLIDIISISPNIRAGDDLDVRRYVRIKKLPGGVPTDSEYVEGVVFTKNILHKQMARHLETPRIMLLSFPLEYQRVEGQLMSLEPLMKQEREYLKHLVARIVAQRPHIVLVERNVSRLALEYLMEANVAVARNVKPEVIKAVSRATSADIISSMDKLALKPRLGRCEKFRVQTFVHSMIPGKRKTFMRFEGCGKELGCTLVLRGGSMEVLRKIKNILITMIPVAYSAKLEGFLLRDELVVPVVINPSRRPSIATTVFEEANDTITIKSEAVRDQERTSAEIAKSLLPYQSAILSGSPYVRFSPPYPLARTREEDTRVTALRRLREFEETEKIIFEEQVSRKEASELITGASIVDSISETFSAASLEDLTPDNLMVPNFSGERAPKNALDVIKMIERQQDIAHAAEYDEAEAQYAAQLSLWESYLAQHKDSMDVKDHDRLFVLETLACTQTDRLCVPPSVRAIRFYGSEDLALGQYIDGVCRDAGKPCSEKACERPMLVHYKTWVHGRYRVMIIPEFHVVDLQSPELEGQIVMWSWCKICRLGSPQAAMSEETYRFSLAKYLELCFYPQDFVRRDKSCEHNSHTDHVRFWMVNNRITFQITVDSVEIRNIIAPPLVLKTKPEKQVQLRNEEYLAVLSKSTAFWDSIAFRISSFNYDVVQPEQLEACKTEMDDLSIKCDHDRRLILRLLSKTYEEVQTPNTIVMTSLQNLAVSWEHEWTAFEQRIMPAGEREGGRRLNAVQLKRLFSDSSLTFSPERRSTSVGASSTFSATSSVSSSPPDPTSIDLLGTIAATFDHDSDSTVYGLPTLPASFDNPEQSIVDTSGGESDTRAIQIPQPSKRKHGGVANLVKLFSDPTLTSPALSPSRSSVPRRSAPDNTRAPKEISSYAATVGVAHLATTTSKPSRIPLRTGNTFAPRRQVGSGRGSRSASTSRSVSRSGSIHNVPISAHKAAADGSAITLKAKSTNVSTQSSRSTLKGKSVALDSESSDMPPSRTPKKASGKDLGVSRPTASSSNKAVANRRVVSTNTRSVSHLTHHFNEKARQQRISSFRARRARPIVEPRTAILVFDNVKDAVREDSDSEDGHDSDGSSGADDEYENEHDHGTFQEDLSHHRSENTPRKASEESFLYDESVALSNSLPDPGPSVIHVRSNEIEILPLAVEAVDSDSIPIVQQSPVLTDTATFPRLSEGESSGNERGSIMKALQTFWAYRGADFTPLEWPLYVVSLSM